MQITNKGNIDQSQNEIEGKPSLMQQLFVVFQFTNVVHTIRTICFAL